MASTLKISRCEGVEFFFVFLRQGMPDGLALGFTLVPPNELAGPGLVNKKHLI